MSLHWSPRNISLPILLSILLLTNPSAFAAADRSGSGSPRDRKVLVTDGSVVQDVGQLYMNITNFGLIGSEPSSSAPYSTAPSAEWPGGSGVEHLFGAGLWLGTIVDGVPHVSTGEYAHEFMSDPEDPLDTLYSQRPGERGSHRYPQSSPDDDRDGLEDEDPINGLDDDGDGVIDEDAAGIGKQHFRCRMRDDTALAQELYPDHTPLGLQILQESFQWSDDGSDDFVGFRYTITNVGEKILSEFRPGIFVDPDVGLRGREPSTADDDRVRYFQGNIRDEDGAYWHITVAYAYDGDGDGGEATSYFGVLLAGQGSPDQSPLPAVESPTFQAFRAELAFDRGGDPTNDAERYELLSREEISEFEDVDADWRFLLNGLPVETLSPGESVVLDLAFVAGSDLQGLLRNAVSAAKVHAGEWFDRDGDPETGVEGREFHVPWYLEGDEAWGELSAHAFHGRIQLNVGAEFREGTLSLVRLEGKNLAEKTWILHDPDPAKTAFFAMVRDEDRGPWPRAYQLRLDETLLDQLVVKSPGQVPRLTLDAQPTPFNPRVSLSYTLQQGGEVTLRIVDARGRLVRELAVGYQLAGPHRISWDGTDNSGSSLASGVYHALIESGGERATRRLVLVR